MSRQRTGAKLNLRLMIALLTRRGSAGSPGPATTTGQISRRRGEWERQRQTERGHVGEDLSYICYGLHNTGGETMAKLAEFQARALLQPARRRKSSPFQHFGASGSRSTMSNQGDETDAR